jgi:hypothetical protein
VPHAAEQDAPPVQAATHVVAPAEIHAAVLDETHAAVQAAIRFAEQAPHATPLEVPAKYALQHASPARVEVPHEMPLLRVILSSVSPQAQCAVPCASRLSSGYSLLL